MSLLKKIVLVSFFVPLSLSTPADGFFDIETATRLAGQSIEFVKNGIVPTVKPLIVAGVTLSVVGLMHDSIKVGTMTSVVWLAGGHNKALLQKKEAVRAQIAEEKKLLQYQKCAMMKINAKKNNKKSSVRSRSFTFDFNSQLVGFLLEYPKSDEPS